MESGNKEVATEWSETLRQIRWYVDDLILDDRIKYLAEAVIAKPELQEIRTGQQLVRRHLRTYQSMRAAVERGIALFLDARPLFLPRMLTTGADKAQGVDAHLTNAHADDVLQQAAQQHGPSGPIEVLALMLAEQVVGGAQAHGLPLLLTRPELIGGGRGWRTAASLRVALP